MTNTTLPDDNPQASGLRAGAVTLQAGQIEYLTSLFHAATDDACQLLVTIGGEQGPLALRDGTLESIIRRLTQSIWRMRWEMNITGPKVEDDAATESEAAE